MSKQVIWFLRCLLLLLGATHGARTKIQGRDLSAEMELGISSSSGRSPEAVTLDWLKANRGQFGQACDRKDLLEAALDKHFTKNGQNLGLDTHYMASGEECRTVTGGHRLVFLSPLDGEDQPTLDMGSVVKYEVVSSSDFVQDAQHTLKMDGQDSGDTAFHSSARLEEEGPACSRSDLLWDAVNTLSGLFKLGSAGQCMKFAQTFVADDSEVGPPILRNFQWKEAMVGRESMLAFCKFAEWLATSNNLDPSKIINLSPSAYFLSNGRECQVIASYTGLSKDGGFWLLSTSPLDANGRVTLDMQSVHKYGITSFTEVPASEKFLLHSVRRRKRFAN